MQAHGLLALLNAVTPFNGKPRLNETEYNALDEQAKKELHEKARKIYLDAGADYVIEDITELPAVIAKINESL